MHHSMNQSGRNKIASSTSSLINLNWSPLRCNVSDSTKEESFDAQLLLSNATGILLAWRNTIIRHILTYSDIPWISILLLIGVYLNYISWNTTMCIVIGYLLGRTNQQYKYHTNPSSEIHTTPNNSLHSIESEDEETRDDLTREYLKSSLHSQRESGLEPCQIPKHIAVIMDGNRRYGKMKYGSVTRGHWDGSKTLVDFAKWCLAEGIEIVTVYAFSTENWNRSAKEVNSLMNIFCKYCEELGVEALEKGIRLKVLSTEMDKIPIDVARNIAHMVDSTKYCDKMTMNICLSYGSRGEILNACRELAENVSSGQLRPCDITESLFESKLLTQCPDPDLIIRTSGEYRLSNFLLWQLAYSEMFFLDKQWPEITKLDLLTVMRKYALDRNRRFGK